MNQLRAGAILNYIVIGMSVLVGLLYTPYMLRMMGQSEYGLYSLVASIIAYLTVLDLGFGNAITRYTAKFRSEGKTEEQFEMFGMFFILYIVISIVAFLIGVILYFNVEDVFGENMSPLEISRAKVLLLILLANLAFNFPMSIFGSIIYAYERFVFPKVVNIIRVVLNLVVMVYLLENGYRAIAMAVVQTVFNVLTLTMNFIYCNYKLKIRMYFRKFNLSFLKEVALYSFWIFLNVIMDRVYWSTGQFVLGAFVGTVAVSVFAVSIQLETMYMQFSTAISSLFLPKVTAMVASGNDEKSISELFIKTGRIQFVVMFFIFCGFVVFGRQFVGIWAGEGYEDVYLITLLFFIALLPPLIQNMGLTILQARNQMMFRSLLCVVVAFVALVLEVLFARWWGGIGCSIAISAVLLIGSGLVLNIYYHRRQGLDIIAFWRNILRMSIGPACVTIAFFYFAQRADIESWLAFVEWVVPFAVCFTTVVFFFSLNDFEKGLIVNPLRKLLNRG